MEYMIAEKTFSGSYMQTVSKPTRVDFDYDSSDLKLSKATPINQQVCDKNNRSGRVCEHLEEGVTILWQDNGKYQFFHWVNDGERIAEISLVAEPSFNISAPLDIKTERSRNFKFGLTKIEELEQRQLELSRQLEEATRNLVKEKEKREKILEAIALIEGDEEACQELAEVLEISIRDNAAELTQQKKAAKLAVDFQKIRANKITEAGFPVGCEIESMEGGKRFKVIGYNFQEALSETLEVVDNNKEKNFVNPEQYKVVETQVPGGTHQKAATIAIDYYKSLARKIVEAGFPVGCRIKSVDDGEELKISGYRFSDNDPSNLKVLEVVSDGGETKFVNPEQYKVAGERTSNDAQLDEATLALEEKILVLGVHKQALAKDNERLREKIKTLETGVQEVDDLSSELIMLRKESQDYFKKYKEIKAKKEELEQQMYGVRDERDLAVQQLNKLKAEQDSWGKHPERFGGEASHVVEDSGQVTIDIDHSQEAPDPDDFKTKEEFEVAWQQWLDSSSGMEDELAQQIDAESVFVQEKVASQEEEKRTKILSVGDIVSADDGMTGTVLDIKDDQITVRVPEGDRVYKRAELRWVQSQIQQVSASQDAIAFIEQVQRTIKGITWQDIRSACKCDSSALRDMKLWARTKIQKQLI